MFNNYIKVLEQTETTFSRNLRSTALSFDPWNIYYSAFGSKQH